MSIYAERNKSGKPTGTWVVEVRREGKIVRKRTKDLKEARQFEANLRAGAVLPRNKLAGAQQFTLADLLNGAQAVYRGTKDEKQSMTRLEQSLTLLGLSEDIRTIRTPQLDKLAATLRARGLNNKTINRSLYGVSAALKWALERDIIDSAPKIPRQPESIGRITFLPKDKEAPFMEWLDAHGYQDVAFVAQALIVTGFRITELMGLKPEAVTKEGWVHLFDGETKNDQGRAAYVGPEMARQLLHWQAFGFPFYHRILDAMREASEALGLDPAITPHVLRHTTATRLNSANVPTATIAKLLGHKTLVTTLKYAHVEQSALIEAAEKLGVPRRGPPEPRDLPPKQDVGQPDKPLLYLVKTPEPEPKSAICSPLRNHSATRPLPRESRLYKG